MRTLVILCALLVLAAAKRQKAGALCDFCLSFVGGIESALENGETEIEAIANALCDTLTKDNAFLDPICKSLIDGELENIINWLKNDEKPADVCAKLHLC